MIKSSYAEVLVRPDRWLTDLQRRWLRPRGAYARIVHTLAYFVNWLSVRLLFRFSVEGLQHLPASGPFILAPNHASPLDAPFLAAALPLALLRHGYWAGKQNTVLKTWLRRKLSWYTQIVPIANDATALAVAVNILERGDQLIWFPEGARSLDGALLEFKPGIAWLLTKCDVAIVPIYIDGAHAACPGSKVMPRWRTQVVVRIGPPETAGQLGLNEATETEEDIDHAIDSLRQSVVRLQGRPTS